MFARFRPQRHFTIHVRIVNQAGGVSSTVRRLQEELPRVIPTIGRETHSKLFEMLFPLNEIYSPESEFVIVLQYNPSFENNEQIVLVGRAGKVHATVTVANGNLWHKANEIFEQAKRDAPVELAKLIGVRKREFDIPFSMVRKWRLGLLKGVAIALVPKTAENLAPRTTETVILDGAIYEIRDQSKSGDLHFELYWGEVCDRVYPTDPPMVRWMKLIRRQTSKHQ